MDIYVQPSANEGLSHSILEAMSAGKPVIVTDVGGAQEVVTDGKTGILIPPESEIAIVSAIDELIANPDQQTAISQAGRRHVNREFDVRRMIKKYQDLYEALVPVN